MVKFVQKCHIAGLLHTIIVARHHDRHQPGVLNYATHDTRLTHGHRKLCLAEDIDMLRVMPNFETLRLMCDFKTLRLTPARHQTDAMFCNQKITSGGRI